MVSRISFYGKTTCLRTILTGSLQYLNPYLSPWGFPPNMVTKVKAIRPRIKKTFPRASQNSLSPYHFTAKTFTILLLKQSINLLKAMG